MRDIAHTRAGTRGKHATPVLHMLLLRKGGNEKDKKKGAEVTPSERAARA